MGRLSYKERTIKKRIFAVSLVVLVLVGCEPVDDFNMWHIGCSGFPTLEEAEHILAEHKDLFDGFLRNNLAHGVRIEDCQQGAYILISHGSYKQKPIMLKAMDEINARRKVIECSLIFRSRFHNN